MPQNTAKKNIAKNGETLEATWIPNDFKGFGKEQKYPLCAFSDSFLYVIRLSESTLTISVFTFRLYWFIK